MSVHTILGQSISGRREWSRVSSDNNSSTKQEPGGESRGFNGENLIGELGGNRLRGVVV